MNNNEYAKNLEIKNRKLLLKIYNTQIAKLKQKIYEATLRGNETQYLNSLRHEVEAEIVVLKEALQRCSKSAAETSYMSGVKLATAGVAIDSLISQAKFGQLNREAMKVLAKTTYEPLSKMAQQIGRATLEYMQRENFENTQTVLKALGKFVDSEFLRKTGIEGIADVVVGSSSWQKTAREIRDKIIKEGGMKVPYYNKKGDVVRFVDARKYAEMVSRTTTMNVMLQGAHDRVLNTFDGEFDLVEILGHSEFPNSPCIPYEGQILSLEGITKGYTTIDEAKANGLFHPNCIHSFAISEQVLKLHEKMEK